MRVLAGSLLMATMIVPFAGAQAQIFGGDDKPIKVIAEKATYKGGTTYLSGLVDVRQGNARIQSDTMKILRAKAPSESTASVKLGAVIRIDAEGNFRYTTPDNIVTGNKGVYLREKGIITVTGNVKVRQPSGNSASTDQLIYNVNTGTIRFEGNCMGDDCEGRPTVKFNQ